MKTNRRSFFKRLVLTALAGRLLIDEVVASKPVKVLLDILSVPNPAYVNAPFEMGFVFDEHRIFAPFMVKRCLKPSIEYEMELRYPQRTDAEGNIIPPQIFKKLYIDGIIE